MRELPQDYLAKVLEGETERRNLEFKPPFLWTDSDSGWLRQKIVRAILGLSNTPSGGLLILGIDQSKDGTSQRIGLNDEQLSSFENAEAIKGHVDGFASVATDFELTVGEFLDLKFVVFQVSDFERRPIICRKDGEDSKILRVGEIYVRSLRAPYSTVRATAEELEELIDLAVDKESHRLAARGWARETTESEAETYRRRISDLDERH